MFTSLRNARRVSKTSQMLTQTLLEPLHRAGAAVPILRVWDGAAMAHTVGVPAGGSANSTSAAGDRQVFSDEEKEL